MKLNKKIMLVLSMAIMALSLFLTDIQVKAAVRLDDFNFAVPYTKPPTSSTQGYINVVFKDSLGNYMPNTYYWCVTPIYGDTASDMDISSSRMDIDVINGTGIKFTAVVGAGMTGVFSIIGCGSGTNSPNSDSLTMEYYSFHGSFVYNYNIKVTIYSYAVYGNFGYVSDNFPNGSRPTVNFLYGADMEYLQKMDTLNANLIGIYQMLTEIKNLNVQDANYQATQISLLNTYLPKIDSCISVLREIDVDLENLYAVSLDIYSTLDSIRYEVEMLRPLVGDIYDELMDLHQDLLKETSQDEDKSDAFEQSSSNQSNTINGLNEQNKVDKIDIDSASGSIDENLALDVDSNYGVLLSTFTNNGTILKMMLAVASMGLISYVLFGKR